MLKHLVGRRKRLKVLNVYRFNAQIKKQASAIP
jgi:hypothetical protein